MFLGAKELALSLFSSHPYAILFVGMFFAGETVLLPALYFSLRGDLDLSYVIVVATVATVLSDFVWYLVGSHMKNRFASKAISARLERNLQRFDAVFQRRGAAVLFMSKFVYGIRTAAQVLAGLHQMRLRTYALVNFLGVLALVGFVALLTYALGFTVERVSEIKHTLEAAFLAIIVVLVLTHIVFGVIWKKWFQQ